MVGGQSGSLTHACVQVAAGSQADAPSQVKPVAQGDGAPVQEAIAQLVPNPPALVS
jgi:hypothetical protein